MNFVPITSKNSALACNTVEYRVHSTGATVFVPNLAGKSIDKAYERHSYSIMIK
jgi:hypothetical protein